MQGKQKREPGDNRDCAGETEEGGQGIICGTRVGTERGKLCKTEKGMVGREVRNNKTKLCGSV